MQRTADAARRRDWVAGTRPPSVEEAEERRALAQAWLADALLEHASIASFARLTLDLLAWGAPAELVAGAQRAGWDEVEHARICFALASDYAGEPLGPGDLRVGDAAQATSLAELAVATVREGCVGETLGALVAAERARRVHAPPLHGALHRIASDEARHAALSWQIVKWAVDRGGAAVRQAVAEAFANEISSLAMGRVDDERSIGETRTPTGRLTAAEESALAKRALHEIVEPYARSIVADPRVS